MTLPRVLVVTLGGTITMTADDGGGIRPTLDGTQLVKAVPQLEQVARIEVATPFMLPGASLTLGHLWQVAQLLRQRLRSGEFAGAVLVQGTDTIEDTAFVMDVLLDLERPVVVTGAMRGAQAPGADGPANLLAAVTVAASADAARCGVLVVLNDEIHAARLARKSHTALPSAFTSPGAGALGLVAEGQARIGCRPVRNRVESVLARMADPAEPEWVPVAQLSVGLDEDARIAATLEDLGYGGAVVEAMGAGHVPAKAVEALASLAGQMPVVLATRVPAGRGFTRTYGFAGSETDLLARGLLPAGSLSASKARLLLSLLLATGAIADDIQAVFGARFFP
ncbi:asparaginase [Pigmentiphaga sp. H8]|uniref:asparaginase n=1 Tax=Pigmentiphaga sp. H8 TaxID=2488560 RepID=UPI000F59D6C3|nr:asparaginase [Pigmentiphaga sp. H8]AZG10485.1 asparaginase [Pigmentiphaga sp. H8]